MADGPEMLILRRGGSHEMEQPKGGAWKIAFADFMTAMMALFLVLWLVNATNDKSRASVARYFNPVKLVETTVTKKGPNDPKDVREPDPHATNGNELPPKKPPGSGPSGKETTGAPTDGAVEREINLITHTREALDAIEAAAGSAASAPPRVGPPQDPFRVLRPGARPGAEAPQIAAQPPSVKGAAPGPANEPAATELARVVTEATKAGPAPAVDVRRTSEGILISLTDKVDFAMFARGSAQPRPEVIGLMREIGAVLKVKRGSIILRGFTDAQPFQSAVYDNWRLSAARAQLAQAMLLRAGLDERRIERVEAYADRKPRNTSQPGAPENRRIEILLREDGP